MLRRMSLAPLLLLLTLVMAFTVASVRTAQPQKETIAMLTLGDSAGLDSASLSAPSIDSMFHRFSSTAIDTAKVWLYMTPTPLAPIAAAIRPTTEQPARRVPEYHRKT